MPTIRSPQKIALTRKRGFPSVTVSFPPEEEQEEGESLAKRQRPSKSRIGKTGGPDPDDYRQDTTIPQRMCYCG